MWYKIPHFMLSTLLFFKKLFEFISGYIFAYVVNISFSMEFFLNIFLNLFTTPVLLVTLTCILTCFYWYKKPFNCLPGTRGLPLLGILLQMRSHPEKIFEKLGKKYGPLYLVKLAWFDVVVIGDPDIAYEAFAKHDCFNNRPQSFAFLSGNNGLIMINQSDFHKEQRRFSLLTLRALGMGRRNFEPSILEITNEMCDKIDEMCECPDKKFIEMQPLLYEGVCRIISNIIFNSDVVNEKESFKEMFKVLTQKPTNKLLSLGLAVVSFAPFLKNIPPFSIVWKRGKSIQQKFHNLIKEEVEEHKCTVDPKNARDFIDYFLIQMSKSKNEQSDIFSKQNDDDDDDDELVNFSKTWKPMSSFSDDQLVGAIRDLFIAGLDTSSSTLGWIVLFLSKYEDVQKKMYQEITTNLGETKPVSMSVMEKLPYVRAVIQEVTRLRPLVPLSAPHLASRDANLRGYHVPKNAIILTNIWAIHHDAQRWPEPDKFLPERHIDSNGKFAKSSDWMNFNVGGRSCLGRQLANMELFLITTTLFQRFRFSLEPGETPDMDGFSEVALKPPAYRVVACNH